MSLIKKNYFKYFATVSRISKIINNKTFYVSNLNFATPCVICSRINKFRKNQKILLKKQFLSLKKYF